MHKLTNKDKNIWNFYISNLNSNQKFKKKSEFKPKKNPVLTKDLKPNTTFRLDLKTKRQINSKKFAFDALIDLHGKKEVEAHEMIKNFIKNSYLNNFKSIIIITGKGTNNQGKLKLQTPLWLKSHELSKFVVGFETMPFNKGGEGALFVKLKNINKYKE